MAMVMYYHDSIPEPERKISKSMYAMAIRKAMLSKRKYASIKAASDKQAATMVSGFRRAAKDNAYPVRIIKQGRDIYIENLKIERSEKNDPANRTVGD